MTELEFLWLWICNRFPDWCPLKCEVKGWGAANFHKISMKATLNKMECVCAGACMLSCFSCVQLFVTPWTIACQALLSVGFFRQEYWSGLPCPPSGDLSDPGIELLSLTSPALVGGFFTTSTTWAIEWSINYHKAFHVLKSISVHYKWSNIWAAWIVFKKRKKKFANILKSGRFYLKIWISGSSYKS